MGEYNGHVWTFSGREHYQSILHEPASPTSLPPTHSTSGPRGVCMSCVWMGSDNMDYYGMVHLKEPLLLSGYVIG